MLHSLISGVPVIGLGQEAELGVGNRMPPPLVQPPTCRVTSGKGLLFPEPSTSGFPPDCRVSLPCGFLSWGWQGEVWWLKSGGAQEADGGGQQGGKKTRFHVWLSPRSPTAQWGSLHSLEDGPWARPPPHFCINGTQNGINLTNESDVNNLELDKTKSEGSIHPSCPTSTPQGKLLPVVQCGFFQTFCVHLQIYRQR